MREGTKYDVIIIGADPTGLTVGLYCGSMVLARYGCGDLTS